ncbi:MAG: type II secretion system GspH family protein [Betaproteobacteria bacterium]|nr:type II secretion system GspH family protein [Betaproteobacteria bacterium]MDH3436800.1 type II secretion system GspH family protein [Betaproteobacteria bacterium]
MKEKWCDGFSMLELVAAIAIIAVLLAAFLNRLHYYQELAERAAMESTLRLIKTGLQVRLAELIITNRQAEAVLLETEDPTRWLDSKPANYVGAYRNPPERGAWYYDAREQQLVYVVNYGDRLELDAAPEPKELRFRARLLTDRVRAAGAIVESVTGVTLAPVRPYRWTRPQREWPSGIEFA